mmetsp:Transcript_41259/g.93319  ORF Transcript_41259/g.93319 Transcript_41259/m.93319 type:complete len:232 (-) Transcript_41259:128-823(-)
MLPTLGRVTVSSCTRASCSSGMRRISGVNSKSSGAATAHQFRGCGTWACWGCCCGAWGGCCFSPALALLVPPYSLKRVRDKYCPQAQQKTASGLAATETDFTYVGSKSGLFRFRRSVRNCVGEMPSKCICLNRCRNAPLLFSKDRKAAHADSRCPNSIAIVSTTTTTTGGGFFMELSSRTFRSVMLSTAHAISSIARSTSLPGSTPGEGDLPDAPSAFSENLPLRGCASAT